MSSARFRMRHLALVSVSVVLLAVGCASSSKAKLQTTSSGPEQRFSMVGNGFETTALISKDGAQGPSVDVGRYDDGNTLRGTLRGRPFQLSIDQAAGKATGQGGEGPVTLNAVEEGDQLKCTGLVTGRPSNITASMERINGTIGLCSYDLARSGEAYVGSRSCAGGISPVTVKFPTNILEWKPINICALMALLMSTP
ncbi:MAG TPA: hypothetical protein VFD38_00975 [Myxococcaceae bacterium]|nr:hypothetical protein [Myxococcaceae bacterium]